MSLLDKFKAQMIANQPEIEPVQRQIRDDDPTMINSAEKFELTGEYAHFYMLYGKGYTVFQNPDYVMKDLLSRSKLLQTIKRDNLYTEHYKIVLVINDQTAYDDTVKADALIATISAIFKDNKKELTTFGYQKNTGITIKRLY